MKDEINDRMKDFYENRTRYYLPRRTFTVIRIDGKSFHTYTRGLNRPFDQGLIDDMDATTKFLCESIQGARFAYVQSDEISILLTDFEKNTTDAWFDGNIQKMCSISASMTTAKFNELRIARYMNEIHFNGESNVKRTSAFFDSRVFTIPLEDEVINYFIARQQDATRNSISAVAQSMYSAKELHGKTTDNMQELIFEKGQNWNDFPVGQKRGRAVAKRTKLVEVKGEAYHKSKDKSAFIINETGIFVERNAWTVLDPPIFTGDKSFIRNEIYGAKLREV
jgi:tRNA(His) guanylyltransferase